MGMVKKKMVLDYHRLCFDVLQMDYSGNLGHELEVGLRLLP
jgi:hypothetical protein